MAHRVFNLTSIHHNSSTFQYVKYLSGELEAFDASVIQSQLAQNGYCLLRNTNLHYNLMNNSTSVLTTNYLRECLFGEYYGNESVNYDLGTDDRSSSGDNDALLNVSMTPQSLYIPYHNELCYTNEFPRILSFVCITPPDSGGQTPLANCVNVYSDFEEDLKDKFKKYGVRYIQNLGSAQCEYNKDKKTWQQMFNTNDKKEAETLCRNEHNYDFEWRFDAKDDTEILRIMYTNPAIVEFDDGVMSFANGIMGFHGNYFDCGYNDYYKDIDLIDRPHHSQWGNGEEFAESEVDTMNALFHKHSISFDWSEGDIVVMDNFKWAHSRNPFEGNRHIVALMGIPYSRQSTLSHQFKVQKISDSDLTQKNQ